MVNQSIHKINHNWNLLIVFDCHGKHWVVFIKAKSTTAKDVCSQHINGISSHPFKSKSFCKQLQICNYLSKNSRTDASKLLFRVHRGLIGDVYICKLNVAQVKRSWINNCDVKHHANTIVNFSVDCYLIVMVVNYLGEIMPTGMSLEVLMQRMLLGRDINVAFVSIGRDAVVVFCDAPFKKLGLST